VSKKNLLIVDPTLKSLGGHSYHYDLAVAHAAVGRFNTVAIYGDRVFPALDTGTIPLYRTLNRLPIDLLKTVANMAFNLLRIVRFKSQPAVRVGNATVLAEVPSTLLKLGETLRARDLAHSFASIIATQPVDDSTHIFIQHARMSDLLAVERASARFPHIRFHLVMRLSPEFTCNGFELLSAFADRLTRLLETRRIYFYTDSGVLTDQYRAFATHSTQSASQFATLPIPVLATPQIPQNQPAPRTDIRLSMLGPARLEKGFDDLPDILASLPQRQGDKAVRLAVQISRDATDPRVQTRTQWLHTYAAHHPGQIDILEGPASKETYFSWFGQTDILLAPYRSPKYAASTSGIFVEALYFLVPTITWRGTWMAMHIEAAAANNQRIGAVIDQFDQLPAAIAHISADLPRYRGDVAQFLKSWEQFNTPENLVAMLDAA